MAKIKRSCKEGKTALVKKGLPPAENPIIVARNYLYYISSLTVGRMNLIEDIFNVEKVAQKAK
ncbi:hypothetical protein [Brevibacillus porteri]|uniref:hypothetical protein n=1 Tax=Brevibacillus porteri TaxID=2126350 RepID=UPI003D22CA70